VPRREPSSPTDGPAIKTPRGFTDACEDVERLGHLLRSIVLLSRNRDFVEDYQCIEQVADIAEETWKRIKPHTCRAPWPPPNRIRTDDPPRRPARRGFIRG
jgi:hypothetical protein